MIFNTKTANSARAQVFKIDHILKLEGYKVQVVQASPQRLFVLPPCNNPAGDTSRRISAAEEEEHHLQFEAWETRPEGGLRESQPERCAPRGRPGAECEERRRSAEPGRRGGVERGRRFTVGTAAAAETAAAGEPAELPSPRPLLSRRRTPRENPVQAAGLGARRGADVTSPPPPPPGGREWGKRQ